MKPSKSVLAFSMLCAAAPLALAQKAATPVDLGTLGGSQSVANAVNSNDVVVGGGNVFSDAFQHAFFTNSDGYIADAGSLIGVFGNSIANGVSTREGMTGTSDQIIDQEGDIASHAFYLTNLDTGMVDLGTNGGTLAEGNGTLGAVVVGASTIVGDVAYCAFSWTQAGGMVNLNTLAADACALGYNSYAFGMNSKGVAVGNSDSPDGTTHAAAWGIQSEKIHDLKTLGGSFAQANAVNDSNLIVGFSTLSGDAQTDAFTSAAGAPMVDIGNLGGSYAQANGVNDSGTVVGASNIAGDTAVHAFIYTTGGGMVDLNTMLPSGSVFSLLTSANAIGADGTIVGVGISSVDGQYHAFTW